MSDAWNPREADASGIDRAAGDVRSGFLDVSTLQRALFALATGDAPGAAVLVDSCSGLDDESRSALVEVLLDGSTPAECARALGDLLLAQGAGRDLVNEAYRAAFYLSDRSVQLAEENPLFAYFLARRSGAPLDKWVHYFPVYHRHLERFRDRSVRVLEIGVYRGGGLRMWQHYLGRDAVIIGLDIDEEARKAAGDSCIVEVGDQADPEVLRHLDRLHGPFDIVIDDGGHTMAQQIATVETLFPLLAEGGVLLVEDTHTSYWPEYGGGLRRDGSFVEWVKARIDDMHGRHTAEVPAGSVWATHLDGLHLYDSMVVLEKRERFPAFSEIAGTSAYLRVDRPSDGHLIDLIAARDAARLQVAALNEEIAALRDDDTRHPEVLEDDPTREELRRTQAALREAHAQLSLVGAEAASLENTLASTNGRLIESWDQIHLMRRSVSWRLTAPIRVVRGLMR